ncbi:MAG: Clp protease N-terminal domain-containing protein [Candidatus Limnocylindria bacterium]
MNPLNAMRTIKKLLTDAEVEARAMGEAEPGAEHLLLAALDLPDGSARRAFERLSVDPEALRPAIVDQQAEALVALGIDADRARSLSAPAPLDPPTGRGVYRSGVSAQEAFQAATRLASRDGPFTLSGAHVVAAVAGMEHGTAARVLGVLGIDRAALAAAAEQELQAARAGGSSR